MFSSELHFKAMLFFQQFGIFSIINQMFIIQFNIKIKQKIRKHSELLEILRNQ